MIGSESRMQGQKSPERSAQPGVYVGVDVCKDWLDVYLYPIGQKLRVSNTPQGLKALKRRLAELPVELIRSEEHTSELQSLRQSRMPSSA